MTPITEGDGQRLAVQVVHTDDAHRRVNLAIRHFAEKDHAVWARLPPVHPDPALPPAREKR
jgi:hypothetical protein